MLSNGLNKNLATAYNRAYLAPLHSAQIAVGDFRYSQTISQKICSQLLNNQNSPYRKCSCCFFDYKTLSSLSFFPSDFDVLILYAARKAQSHRGRRKIRFSFLVRQSSCPHEIVGTPSKSILCNPLCDKHSFFKKTILSSRISLCNSLCGLI